MCSFAIFRALHVTGVWLYLSVSCNEASFFFCPCNVVYSMDCEIFTTIFNRKQEFDVVSILKIVICKN